ncbi:MAG TPA: hypothetical protein PLV42_04010 [bacterium]|nr:hypothetical protein [bacterium]
MSKPSLIFFLALFAFTCSSVAAADNADSIVVWRIEPQTGVTEKDANAVSAIIAMEVVKISGKRVIGEAEMKSLMVGEEKKLSCGADDTACYAEIGAALGAPESVIGTLSKLGDYWMLYLQRLNVRNATILGRAEFKAKGDINLLVEGIPQAVGDLFDKIVTKPAPAVPQTAPSAPAAAAAPRTAPGAMPQAPAMVEESVAPTPSRGLTALGWSGVGLLVGGGAVMALAGVAHWQTGEAKKDYDWGKTGSDRSTYDLWSGTMIASYVVGGLALGTGAALLIWDLVAERPVQAAVMPLPGGAMLTLTGRW